METKTEETDLSKTFWYVAYQRGKAGLRLDYFGPAPVIVVVRHPFGWRLKIPYREEEAVFHCFVLCTEAIENWPFGSGYGCGCSGHHDIFVLRIESAEFDERS